MSYQNIYCCYISLMFSFCRWTRIDSVFHNLCSHRHRRTRKIIGWQLSSSRVVIVVVFVHEQEECRRSTVDVDDDDEEEDWEWGVTTSCGGIELESRESCSRTPTPLPSPWPRPQPLTTPSRVWNGTHWASALPKKGSESLDSAWLILTWLDSAFSSPASSPVVQNLLHSRRRSYGW